MTTNPIRKGLVGASLGLAFCLSASAVLGQTATSPRATTTTADTDVSQIVSQTPSPLEASWNKSPDQYEYGDRFTITLKAKKKCFAYLFYITDQDESLALFPARNQSSNVIGTESPLPIENVDSNMMQVDHTPGRLVLLSIAEGKEGQQIRKQVLQHTDWQSDRKPMDHWLTLSGTQLMKKLEALKNAHPNVVHYTIEDAPRAKTKPHQLRFGKPARYEISQLNRRNL
jgi:hypothetical protein